MMLMTCLLALLVTTHTETEIHEVLEVLQMVK